MSIHFAHTQKLEAWAQGKHAVIWLDGKAHISEKHMEQVKRELVTMLIDKGAVLSSADWKTPQPPRPICTHCDEYLSLPYSSYCPFCYDWAKQHAGELPPDQVLTQRHERAKKYGPKENK